MSGGILAGLRLVEAAAFVAAPLGGMTLAQMGADVIRIDALGGGLDHRRWPVTEDGTSLFWCGLNKSKRSVALDLSSPEGRELAMAIACAPGDDAGIFLTNFPPRGWLDHEKLKTRRSDLIQLTLQGDRHGGSAVDYTVNARLGLPYMTGPAGGEDAVNHVLPAWDIAAGLYLATGLLAAERARRLDGKGRQVSLALSDVMLASVGNLGYIADVQVNGAVRPPLGNDLYGALGRDFATADGRHVMIVAISNRQWRAIGRATGLTEKLAMIGPLMDVDLDTEGGRFTARAAHQRSSTAKIAARAVNRPPSVSRSTSISGPIIASFSARPVARPMACHCRLEIATIMTCRPSAVAKSRPSAP